MRPWREGGQRTGYVVKATSRFVFASLLVVSGCSSVLRSYDYAPSGLTRSEEGFRLRLVQGAADSAFVHELLHGSTAPGDELLRGLYGAVGAYYAGRYAEAGALLDRAALLSEERATKSISRSALSLLSSDKALPYEPARTERLLIPYYAALSYLRLGDRTGLLVEARRLSALLEQYEDDVTADEAALHAALRVFAGAVFQATGERNDAAVAYRQANGFAGMDSVYRVPPRDSADIIVFVEAGFVAHRVEEGLSVLLAPEEMHALREGSADARYGIASLISQRVLSTAGDYGFDATRARTGSLVVGAPIQPVVTRPRDEACRKDGPAEHEGAPSITERLDSPPDSARQKPRTGMKTVVTTTRTEQVTKSDGTVETTTTSTSGVAGTTSQVHECPDDEEPYLLRVAWPAYRWTSRAPGSATLLDSRGDTLGALRFADVSSAVVQDFRRELPLVVARTIARGAVKAALTRAAEHEAEEKHEALGDIVGVLGNIGNVLLERADTRSWHLLPGAVGVAHVRVPAGEHTLRVQLPSGRELALGTLTLRSREMRVVSARSW